MTSDLRKPPAIPNLATHVRHRLEEMLNAPEWRDGGRLPPETELAAQVGVSRPTLRKALAELREEGRIVALRGSANFVQPVAEVRAPELMPQELTIRTVYDMRRCLHFRQVVECAAAEEAARQRDPAAIDAIATAQARMADLAPGENVFDADFAFHLSVAYATCNPYFPFVLGTIRDQIRLTVEFTRKLQERPSDVVEPRVVREHASISDAIRASDPEAARESMACHMRQTLHRLLGE